MRQGESPDSLPPEAVERRRAEFDDLPTKLEASFRDMDADDKNRLQLIGSVLIVVGLSVPLAGGIFRDLATLYLIFSGFVATIGVLLAWPRLGVYVLTAAPGAVSKLVPSSKLKELLQPVDRRAPREAE